VILKISQKGNKNSDLSLKKRKQISALVKTCKLPSIRTLGTFKAKIDVLASPPPL
jgi:hypothetical protein